MLQPRIYPECPLGLKCSGNGNGKAEYLWWDCSNRYYCQGVTEPWLLPLRSTSYTKSYNCSEVNLQYYPHNFTQKSWRQYMKNYGWATAEPVRIFWYSSAHVQRSGEVQQNDFRHGFAMAVPLEWRVSHGNCKRDKYGLWWTTWGSPPKNALTRWHGHHED